MVSIRLYRYIDKILRLWLEDGFVFYRFEVILIVIGIRVVIGIIVSILLKFLYLVCYIIVKF